MTNIQGNSLILQYSNEIHVSGSLSGTQDFSSWLVEQMSFLLKPLQKSLGEVQSFTELLKAHGWEPPSNVQEIQNTFAINDFSSLEDLLERVIEANEAAERMLLLQSYIDYKSA